LRTLTTHIFAADSEYLLRDGIPDDDWGLLERPLYLMAAMTGLRQGELLGLRWRDIDWLACKVRVRQSYVRGEFKPATANPRRP
jgi:integrase